MGGRCDADGGGMGHIEDPDSLELEQESVITAAQFSPKGCAHRTALTDEKRPITDRGKAEASPTALATGER